MLERPEIDLYHNLHSNTPFSFWQIIRYRADLGKANFNLVGMSVCRYYPVSVPPITRLETASGENV